MEGLITCGAINEFWSSSWRTLLCGSADTRRDSKKRAESSLGSRLSHGSRHVLSVPVQIESAGRAALCLSACLRLQNPWQEQSGNRGRDPRDDS